jgi:AcrR family transcriptional regulator
MGKSATPEVRRRLSADERRARILKAGTEVFAERGYAGASMAEIAKRSGIVASVIYDHFPSKRSLHVELLELHGRELIARAIEAIEVTSAERILRDTAAAFFRMVEEDPFAWRFLFRDPPAEPEVVEVWRRIQDQATAGLAGLIEASAPGADLMPGLPPSTAAWMLAKMGQGATNALAEWWFEHREVERELVVELSVRMLWDGYERIIERAGGRR